MPDDTRALQHIQALRAARRSLDRQVRTPQLQTRSELETRRRTHTAEDRAAVRTMTSESRTRGKTTRHQRPVDQVQGTLEKAKRSNDIVVALRKQIDAIVRQLSDAQRELDELHGPDESRRHESGLRVRELTRQVVQLRHELGQASDTAGRDQQEVDSARKRQRELEREKGQVQGQLVVAQRALGEVVDRPPAGVGDVLEKIKAKQADHVRLKSALEKGRLDLHAAIGGLYVDPHPARGVARLDDGIPFLLMPVRIETRFVTTENAPEMWLRIYPDDIAIHTHEEVLTDAEVTEGEAYWKELFAATKAGGADGEDRKKAAWTHLTTLFPPQRAAWVAMQTRPSNWSADLAAVPDADALEFPEHAATKTTHGRAPRAT